MQDNITEAAKAAHNVHRAYCRALGDSSIAGWDEAPDWQRSSAVKGVEAIIHDRDLSAEGQHEAWLAHKEAEGWKWGPVKDPDKKEHPCMVPYHELSPWEQAKDAIFQLVALAVWIKLG